MKILDNHERLVEVFDEQKLAIIDNVLIFNHHLVHPVMLEAFEFMLKSERNHNLTAIFVCPEGPPGERLGEYNNRSRSFILNLPKILEYTIATEDKKQGMSLTAGVWTNMIHVFLHELRHNTARATDIITINRGLESDLESPEGLETLEQDAAEYATLTLERLAAEKRIECPPLAEIPWFNTNVMQVLVDEIADGEKEWAGAHKRLIDKELVFENGDEFYTSIYDYFRATTEQPDLYDKSITLQMADEEEVKPPTNIFDEEVLPGEQMNMFQKPIMEGANPETVTVPEVETIAPAKEVHVEASLEELEMLDSVDETEPGEEDYGDVVYEESVSTETQVTSPAPAAPAPQAAPVPNTPAHIANTELAMCHAVYGRLVHHMFTVGGHKADGTFGQAGQVAITPLPLSGAEIDSGLFAGSYTINMETMSTVWDDCNKSGGIRGRTFRNGALPGYDLMINWLGNIRRVRLVAQNPTKGSAVAAKARAGAHIVWLIDQDDTNGSPFVGSWENGVYKPCKR